MKKLVILSVILFFAFLPVLSKAAQERSSSTKTYNQIIHKVLDYALTTDNRSPTVAESKSHMGNVSLGITQPTAAPGITAGRTYHDLQHLNTTGRMIGIGRSIFNGGADTNVFVHLTWMDLPGPGSPSVSAVYVAGHVGGVTTTETFLTFSPEISGFFNIQVSENNRAIISGHYTVSGNPAHNTPTMWYDEIPLDGEFGINVRIDSALWKYQNPFTGSDRNVKWPHIAYHVRPDGNRVLHVAGVTNGDSTGAHILYYFRREGQADSSFEDGSLSGCGAPLNLGVSGWDCPWVYDTAWASVALVLASKKSGKVALVWTANRPNYTATPGCDTCSDNNDLGMVFNRFDNDLYYQISDDYGITWNNRVNVTKVSDSDRWRPYNDITAMFKGDPPNEKLCIAWVSSDWDKYVDEGFIGYGARLYYWDENFPGLGADPSLIVDKRWDPNMCNAGAFNLNIAKPQISECNNGLYCLYVDLWDGHNRSRGNPDCSQRGWNGDPEGSVNGELMVSMSFHSGLAWDISHNLTNSPTSKCIDDCDSDHWPSMPRHGFVTMDSDTAIEGDIVLPRPVIYPNTVGAWWLPVMYINDKDPGTVLFDNSTWQNNPVKFFYMGCVGPGNFLLCGDANNDGVGLDILDLTYIVDYIFRGGPSPPISEAADVNWDSNSANIIDLTAIVDFLFRGGSKPDCGQM